MDIKCFKVSSSNFFVHVCSLIAVMRLFPSVLKMSAKKDLSIEVYVLGPELENEEDETEGPRINENASQCVVTVFI